MEPLITILESIDVSKFTKDCSIHITKISEELFGKISELVFENYHTDPKVVTLGKKYYEHFPKYLRGVPEYPHCWEKESEDSDSIGIIINVLKNPVEFQLITYNSININSSVIKKLLYSWNN